MFQDSGANVAEQSKAAATFIGQSIEQLTPFLFNAIAALAVLIIGMWLAGRLKRLAMAATNRSGRMDDTLRSFLGSLIYYGLVALVVITTLGVFGVPTTSFAAILGAAGLAIGLALQGTLNHIASGVMMLAFRPFNVGDYVETGGHAGTVKAMTLFTTEIATVDNRQIIIPNGQVWDNPIINYSAYDKRRVDIVFGVSYADDLDKAIACIKSVISEDDRVLKDPEPVIAVESLGDSSVNITSRSWVTASDYFPVKWALTKAVKERFDADGVSIPFPTRTLFHENSVGEATE
ncbi:MAG: mechanosensitive ion channel [Parvularculaceae bacterium]